MPLRVLIAADQERERIVLRYLLEQIKAVQVVGETVSGLASLKCSREQLADLVIMDVGEMEEGAWQAVSAWAEQKDAPLLALVGEKPERAVEAFAWGALDYLVKPVESKRIEKSVLRARERLLDRERIQEIVEIKLKERIEFILGKYRQANKTFNLLPVRGKGKITLLKEEDIVYCESQVKKVIICTRNGMYISNFTLNELAVKLSEIDFFRAHPAFMVNLNYVKEILNFGEGSYVLRLHGCERDIILSRSRAKLLRHRLGI
jgi:two-component system LytT family response regulator/two-component system response regulator LytT